MSKFLNFFTEDLPENLQKAEVIREKNIFLYNKILYSISIFALISLYTAYTLSNFFPYKYLLPWLILILSTDLYRLMIYLRFRKSAREIKSHARWSKYYIASGILSAMMWSVAAMFFFPASFSYQILMLGLITIIATFMTIYLSMNKFASQISVLLIMTPLIVQSLFSQNIIGLQLSVMLSVYCIFLIAFSLSISKSNLRSLYFSVENRVLLDKFKNLFEDHMNILEKSPVGMLKIGRDFKISYMNDVLKSILGIPFNDERAIGLKVNKIPPVKNSGLLPYIEEIMSGKTVTTETRYISQKKKNLFISIHGSPLFDDNGFAGAIVAIHDISKHKESEAALHEEKKRAHVILTSINDLVASTDINGIVDYATPSFTDYLGWTPEELMGKNFFKTVNFIDEEIGDSLKDPISVCLQLNQHLRLTQPLTVWSRKGEKHFSVELTIAPIHDKNKTNITGAVIALHDISDLRILTEKLTHQATHDSLTGLINRVEFERRVAASYLTAERDGDTHIMAYLDMDRFKIINDTCGHAGGDALLKQITPIIQNTIRSSDTLARLGGDEFGILLNNCTAEKAKIILTQILDRIREFKFYWEDRVFDVGMSMGMVEITSASSGLSDIFNSADSACYVAKEQGRNRLHVYKPDDNALISHKGGMQWFTRLNHALENDNFVLYFQPIKKLNMNRNIPDIRGEFLLRLKDTETDTLISPGLFISAAERYQLMPAIDGWVIRNIFRSISEISKSINIADSIFTINISAQSISEEYYTTFISNIKNEYEINPKNICFEITETGAFTNINLAIEFMLELKKMGFHFALDDFGSGISSMANLKILPIDIVKIDGEFIKSISKDSTDQIMVTSIVQICRAMKLHTIAEYVETDEVLSILKKKGVTYVQGFKIAKPQLFSQNLLLKYNSDMKIPPAKKKSAVKKTKRK